MNFHTGNILTNSKVKITNLLPEIGIEDMRAEIVQGLTSERKYISSKYFYNEAGSRLFEEITLLPEYYPTRTEKRILKSVAPALMDSLIGYDIIELGSGDCSKISILFRTLPENPGRLIHYLPMDVSHSAILKSARGLSRYYPDLVIEGYVVDFTTQFNMIRRDNPALICFFGSTIGNFDHKISRELLSNISKHMKKGDALLLGMDLVKPQPILHAAYNDEQGLTEAFNKNILLSVNDIINSNFNPDEFKHLAFYNNNMSRIEMHLVANTDISIGSPFFPEDLVFKRGESIHTENSHKYTDTDIREFARAAGLDHKNTFTDKNSWARVGFHFYYIPESC